MMPVESLAGGRMQDFRVFMDGTLRDYYALSPGDDDPMKRAAASQAYARWARAGKYIFIAALGDPARARACVDAVTARMRAWELPCLLDTCARWADEYFASPEAFERGTEREKTRRR